MRGLFDTNFAVSTTVFERDQWAHLNCNILVCKMEARVCSFSYSFDFTPFAFEFDFPEAKADLATSRGAGRVQRNVAEN